LATLTASLADGETLVNGDSLSSLYKLTTTATTNSGAGTYTITGEGANSNYEVEFTNNGGSLYTITKAKLTVTADDQQVSVGSEAPTYTASYDGFVNGDSEKSLSGTLTFSCDYDKTKGIGSYTITPSGLTSDNYEITYVDGKVVVSRAGTNKVDTPTVKGWTYGECDHAYIECAIRHGTIQIQSSEQQRSVDGLDGREQCAEECG
jgi:hypothetical protein